MSKYNFSQMNDMQFDVLKEIGNIGAGNATTALSQMVGSRIDMKTPSVQLTDIGAISDIVGGPENIIVGILITLSEDIEGMMMFVLEQSTAHFYVNILMGKNLDDFSDFDEMDLSVLQEIGNILSGAYLSSLSTLTNLHINQSIPYMTIDMAGAILSVPAIEFGKLGDKALLIQSKICEDDNEANGYFILIPTEESYSKILSSLGM